MVSITQIVAGSILYGVILWVVKKNNQGLQHHTAAQRVMNYGSCSIFWMIIILTLGALLGIIYGWFEWYRQAILWPYYLFFA